MRSNPTSLIGDKTFAVAFPMIESPTVYVTETEHTVFQSTSKQWFVRPEQLGDYIDCHGDGCDGAVFIGDVWHDMVAKREKHRDVTRDCEGNKGQCNGSFVIQIGIQFRP
jgi:hypothetical protein